MLTVCAMICNRIASGEGAERMIFWMAWAGSQYTATASNKMSTYNGDRAGMPVSLAKSWEAREDIPPLWQHALDLTL